MNLFESFLCAQSFNYRIADIAKNLSAARRRPLICNNSPRGEWRRQKICVSAAVFTKANEREMRKTELLLICIDGKRARNLRFSGSTSKSGAFPNTPIDCHSGKKKLSTPTFSIPEKMFIYYYCSRQFSRKKYQNEWPS